MTRRSMWWGLFFAFSLASLAHGAAPSEEFKAATPEELALKEVAGSPGAHAVILLWSDRQDDHASQQSEYFRVKILDDEGKKYGDIEIPYLRGFGEVSDIRARTIRPDGTIVPFNGKIYDKTIIKSRWARIQAKTFAMPEVQSGSILEYRYVRSWPGGLLYSTKWVLQKELPILKASLYLKPHPDVTYRTYFIHVDVPGGKTPTFVRDHYELELENLPAFEEEKYAPPDNQLKPRVEFFYSVGNLGTKEEFWKKTGDSAADEVEKFIGNRKEIKQEVGTIVTAGDAPLVMLRKIYDRVQKIENLSYQKSRTEQEVDREKRRENKNVGDVLKNGYGYRFELNRLFVALARAAGLEAYSALVSTRDDIFFNEEMLSAAQLNGELAVVIVDGRESFYDPGTLLNPFGELPWQSTDVNALKLARKASTWLKTPESDFATTKIMRSAKLKLEDGILKGRVKVSFTGHEALVRRLDVIHDDEAAQKKKVEDEAKGWFPEGSVLKVVSLSGFRTNSEPLVAELDVELPNLESSAGSRSMLRLSIFESRSPNPFAVERRKHPIYFPYESLTEDQIEVELPEGAKVYSLPSATNSDAKALAFSSKWKGEQNKLRLERKLTINSLLVSAQNYGALRSFFSRVARADQENAVIALQ